MLNAFTSVFEYFEYFDNSSSMDSTTPSATEENNGRDGAELSGGVSSLMSSLPKSLLKNRFDPSVLKRAWEVDNKTTTEDWLEWMRKLSLQMLAESPSPVLHCCATLASTYQPLARHLFNAAFVAVWNELTNGKKKEGKWACGKQCSSVIVLNNFIQNKKLQAS